jgi:hypothetical protein
MYLQVMTLSDIVDANGQRISDEAFKGQKLSDRYSRLKWTRQPVVTTKQRNLWKAALKAAFTSSGMVLKHPLGAWTGPPTQVWRNFYNPGTNRVVTSMTGSTIRFTEYTVSQRTRHHADVTPFATASMYVSLEDVNWNIMIPATVMKTRTRNVIATFHSHAKTSRDARNEVGSFGDYIKTLPDHVQQLLMHVEFIPGGEDMLMHCLKNDKPLKIGTDGSLNLWKETASFGWLLIGNQNVLIRGAGPVDGVSSVLSSTRAELFGIAAPNLLLFHFMKFHQIESKSKCVKCVDNRAAISRVNRTQHKQSPRRRYSDDIDIVTVIVNTMKESTLQHRLRWVKAHQDDKKPYKDLDIWG